MYLRFLGVHNAISNNTNHVSILIDDIVAIDAGSITSELSFDQQEKIKAIFLTHSHYDHIKEIPLYGFNNVEKTTQVYATKQTLKLLSSNLLNGKIYPNFTQKNSFLEIAPLELIELNTEESYKIEKYQIRAFPVIHKPNAVGYEIKSSLDESVFISGDTFYGLKDIWRKISPDLIVLDTTFPNRLEETAFHSKHLCPSLIKKEMDDFYDLKGYLPEIYLYHFFPKYEDEIKKDIDKINKSIDTTIHLAKTGQLVSIKKIIKTSR